MNSNIQSDPRYLNLDFDRAVAIIDRFVRDFGDQPPEQVEAHPEGKLALNLYGLALGWLVLEGLWKQAGLDPTFVASLGVEVYS